MLCPVYKSDFISHIAYTHKCILIKQRQPIHNIYLPARSYLCCDVLMYSRLHSVQLYVYFCNLLRSLNHSTLSRVTLTTWYTLPGISRAKVVVKHQMGESSGGFSNTGLFMVSCGGIKSRLWSQLMLCGWSSPILLDLTVKEVFKGKPRINYQISTFHSNITSFKS